MLKLHFDFKGSLGVKLFWYSIFVGFLFLPLGINLSTPFFVLSMSAGVLLVITTYKTNVERDIVFYGLPILFLLGLVSLLYTEDLKAGADLVVRLLPLALFPIIFLYVKEDKRILENIFSMLLIGILFSLVINLYCAFDNALAIENGRLVFDSSVEGGYSFYESFNHGGSHFIGIHFAKTLHPTYISLYVLVCAMYFEKRRKRFWRVIVFILLIYLFLLSSRASFLVLIVLLLMFLFKKRANSKNLIVRILFLIFGILLIVFNPRTETFFERMINFKDKKNYNYTTSEQSRILIYKTCLDLVKERPLLGYGIGDVNAELSKKYNKNAYKTLYEKKYNAHNQYFQTMLQAGIFALLALIFPLGVILFRGKNNQYVLATLVIFIILMSFESLLVRYNGIIFYAIVIPFLMRRDRILFEE